MATIAQIVEQIRQAVYGKDVRENIAEGIEKCYTDTVSGVNAASAAASSANAAASAANEAASAANEAANTVARSYSPMAIPNLLDGINVADTPIDLSVIEQVGQYIAYDGSIGQSVDFCITTPINVRKGQTVALYARGYNVNISLISIYNNGTYTPVAVSVDSTLRLYKYTATNDCKVAFSYSSNVSRMAMLSSNYIDSIEKYIYSEISFSGAVYGSFINMRGEVSGGANDFRYTPPVLVRAGSTIVFTAAGYNTNVSMIAKYNGAGVDYTPLVICTNSNVNEYIYHVEEDMMVTYSYDNTKAHSGYRYIDPRVPSVVEEYVYAPLSFEGQIWGRYIDYGGSVSSGANDFRYTPPFLVHAGQTIVFNAAGYLQNVSMIAKYNGANTNYTPLVISTNSNVNEYRYHAEEDMQISLSYDVTKSHSGYRFIDAESTKIEYIDFSVLFPKMSVIGDSLSSGCLYINDTTTDYYGDSWLSFIARRCGVKRNHYSQGGLTCKTWLEQYLTKMQGDEASNAYFIALGTNDSWLLPYDIGTASDAAGTNTFAGYYKQIIEAVQTKAPNAAIFCLSLYKSNQTYNPLIRTITGQYNNTYYIDIPANSIINPDTGGVWSAGSHFTTVGYRYIANVIYEQMNAVVSNNINAFKFFGQYNSVGNQYDFGS